MALKSLNVSKGRKVVDLSNSLYLLDPTAAPLWTLVDRLSKYDCFNSKVEWTYQLTPTTVITEHNYTQIFRKNVEITKTLMALRLAQSKKSSAFGSERSYMRKKKGIELLRDFECAMIFGKRHIDPNGPTRAVGGIDFFNGLYSSVPRRKSLKTIKEPDFEVILREIFKYGAAYRTFLYGLLPSFMKGHKGRLRAVPPSHTYGIKMEQYVSPHGTLNMAYDPMLQDHGVFVDLSSLKLRNLQGRAPQLLTNVQNPGDDIVKDSYIAEWTFELHGPHKGAIIGKSRTGTKPYAEGSLYSVATLDEILGMNKWKEKS